MFKNFRLILSYQKYFVKNKTTISILFLNIFIFKSINKYAI
ncbi:hypothetical protein AC7_1209 [Clostridium perfringens NCTC 8239]|nr:hypothetical protein AC7_1209 [Clostridium perfringens NCTC 8239]